MRHLFPVFLAIFFCIGCDSDNVTPSPQTDIPIVKAAPIYDVISEANLIYAEGLSHESINSTAATAIPLQLDVFVPDNDLGNRPAIMFIHGGGFIGGTRKQGSLVNMAKYFAARGWVTFSIDYRLRDDFGTTPLAWEDAAVNIEASDVPQYLAIYPAHRDAKAALRWIIANAEVYKINTDYITVGGGSAGAITAIAIGISEQEDFRDELSESQDPTLATANTGQSYKVQTILDFWGSRVSLDALEMVYGHQRFDANDPPIMIVHGTEDPTVPFSSAEELKTLYENNGIPLAYYPLEGRGHGPWNATVDGKSLSDLSFEFIIEQQQLTVE